MLHNSLALDPLSVTLGQKNSCLLSPLRVRTAPGPGLYQPPPYLDVLVPGPQGVEQVLDVGLVLLGLPTAVRQHVLEEAVLQTEAGLQLLQHLGRAQLELANQGAAQVLEKRRGGEERVTGRRGEERRGEEERSQAVPLPPGCGRAGRSASG